MTPQRSDTHLVLIPSYNPGPKVEATVRGALAQWSPVWVVVDGSTDGSAQQLSALAASEARSGWPFATSSTTNWRPH